MAVQAKPMAACIPPVPRIPCTRRIFVEFFCSFFCKIKRMTLQQRIIKQNGTRITSRQQVQKEFLNRE